VKQLPSQSFGPTANRILSLVLMIREATSADCDAIWQILEPVVRAGETYALACDLTKEQGLAYWFGAGHRVFVAVEETRLWARTSFARTIKAEARTSQTAAT
jgi:hypothetical protein